MRRFFTTWFFRAAFLCGILSGAVSAFANPPAGADVVLVQNKPVPGRGVLIPVDGATIKKIVLSGPGVDSAFGTGSCQTIPGAFQERGRKDGFQVVVEPWSNSGFLPVAPGALIADEKKPDVSGLNGQYFPNPNLDGKPLGVRVDAAFPSGADPLVKPAGFSIRWTGFIKPPAPGKHRIRLAGEGKSRVWIEDRLVYDGWDKDPKKGGMGEFTNLPEFKPGELCPLRIEYRGTGNPQIALSWMTFAKKDFSTLSNAGLVVLVLALPPSGPNSSDFAREQEEFLLAAGAVNPATVAVFQLPAGREPVASPSTPGSGAFPWACEHLPALFRMRQDAAAPFANEFFSNLPKKKLCKDPKF